MKTTDPAAPIVRLRRPARWMEVATGVLVMAMYPGIIHAQPKQPPDSLSIREAIDQADFERLRGIYKTDSLRRDSVFGRLGRVMAQLGRLPWMIPEAHDEQPLSDGAGGYGPMAYVFASPYIDGFTTAAQFQEHGTRGVLAAVVYINDGGGALPPTYRRLQLTAGVNCVWLTFAAPVTWRAYVTPASVDTTCVEQPPPATLLRVRRDTPSASHRDYPPVARFGESLNGEPLIGIKCLAGWCHIGPSAGFGAKNALLPSAAGLQREADIRGWHDEQQLADSIPGVGLRPGGYAAIEPVPNINTLTAASFRSQWRRVATIFFRVAPATGTSYAKWGLQRGRNQLELIEFESRWVARIRRPDGTFRYWPNVMRHLHFDATVPGTARFRWTKVDEGAWVPCGQACCLVDGHM